MLHYSACIDKGTEVCKCHIHALNAFNDPRHSGSLWMHQASIHYIISFNIIT